MEPILVTRRPKDQFEPKTEIVMNFPSINHAINWMEDENDRDDREFDIASVRLCHNFA